MAKRETIRRITINQIKAIARRQIAELGQTGLSLKSIAREIGMSGPAIYRYFPNRNQLLLTIVDDAWSELESYIVASTAEVAQKDIATLIRHVIDAYRHWVKAHAAEYELMFSTAGVEPQAFFSIERIWAILLPVWDCMAQKIDFSDERESLWNYDATFPFPENYVDEKPAVLCRIFNLWALWSHVHGLLILEINHTFSPGSVWVDHLYQEEIRSFIAKYA